MAPEATAAGAPASASPMSPQVDPSGGFEHGGWHARYFDEPAQQWTLENLTSATAFLFGRRTYDMFAAHWPAARPEEQPIAEPLNTKPKHVASTTLTEPLSWDNSTLLKGDAVAAVAALKRHDDGELHVIGSAELVHTLLEHDLVDELRLMIDPVLIGSGKRIFPNARTLRPCTLAASTPTSTGALLTTCRR